MLGTISRGMRGGYSARSVGTMGCAGWVNARAEDRIRLSLSTKGDPGLRTLFVPRESPSRRASIQPDPLLHLLGHVRFGDEREILAAQRFELEFHARTQHLLDFFLPVLLLCEPRVVHDLL